VCNPLPKFGGTSSLVMRQARSNTRGNSHDRVIPQTIAAINQDEQRQENVRSNFASAVQKNLS